MIAAFAPSVALLEPLKPLCGALRAFARVMAVGSVIVLPSLAHAQNCLPDDQAAYRMLLLQQEAQRHVSPIYKVAWYSTTSSGQAYSAYTQLGHYAHLLPDPNFFDRLHIMVIDDQRSVVLSGAYQETCGFVDYLIIDTQSARNAISAANTEFENEQAALRQQTPSQGQRSTQAGDPVFNMSDEDRRAWQMMQGIIQGNDPAGGLQDLLTGNGQ